MSSFLANMRLARQDFFKLSRYRPAPAWAMWLMTLAVSLSWGLGLLALILLLGRRWPQAGWWLSTALPFLFTSVMIGLSFHVVYTAVERHSSDRFLAWINGRPSLPVVLCYGGISTLCVMLGFALSYLLLGSLPGYEGVRLGPVSSWLSIALTGLIISVLWSIWWSQQWQEEYLKRQAQEAQLRLLQAQIEPHFLFNTLANVHGLMDHDPALAKQMLASFTDYLRVSLGRLRAQDSTVAQEFELARSYLQLLQIRMADRLQFDLQADDEAQGLVLPPLLLQPLVENAVVHGLEPSIDGGTVRMRARVNGQRLLIEVQDDGRGLNALPRPGGRRGNNMALENIRERLQARYGSGATLELQNAEPGTRALISIPMTDGTRT